MQGRQTRRVRVTEADDRATGALPGLQGALPWRIGVARLDHGGVHRRHPGAPAAHRAGPAIAVAEGQLGGMKLDNAVRARLVRGARHHQGMGHRWPVGFKPRLLGQQIAFHPARARRKQHGGVHQPRTWIGGRGLQYPQGFSDFLVQSGNQAQFALLNIDIAHGHRSGLSRSRRRKAAGPALDATRAFGTHHESPLDPETAPLKRPFNEPATYAAEWRSSCPVHLGLPTPGLAIASNSRNLGHGDAEPDRRTADVVARVSTRGF
ncbi:hypothetical protein D3C86_1509480 [compost metagenome]